MKNIKSLVLIVSALLLFASCVSSGKRVAGELPRNWWKMDVDPLENLYRDEAAGVEKLVKLFVATSDEPTNATESDAIEDATMKVSVQVSRYLAVLVTNITQSSRFNDYIREVAKDNNLKDSDRDQFINEIKNQTNSFTASISTTQFSSMKIIGTHSEKLKDKGTYKGWVCVSMTDDVLEQTKKLQEAAFQTILDLNPEYKQIIADINTEITKSIKENIVANTGL